MTSYPAPRALQTPSESTAGSAPGWVSLRDRESIRRARAKAPSRKEEDASGIATGTLAAVLLGGVVLAAALPAPAAAAEDDVLRDRIELVCTEQPSRHVAFGEDGRVTYEQQTPREQEPVRLTVVRSDTSQRYTIDAARIESDAPYLQADRATWTYGEQVDAGQGRVRLNLKTNVLTVAEYGADGQASFRRFQCHESEPAQSTE
jgi:hypothetical protein